MFIDGPCIEGRHAGGHCGHPGLVLKNAKLVTRAHLEGKSLEKGRPEMVECLEFYSDPRTLGKQTCSARPRLRPGQHQPLRSGKGFRL